MRSETGRSAPRIVEPGPGDWEEYRALRLEALQREPSAYGSTYDDAVARPDDFWQRRLAGGESINLVATVEGRMVGMVGVLLAAPDDPSAAVVVGVYVAPEHRGRGIGRMMMESLLARLAERTEIATVRLSVNSDRTVARALYTALGFQIVPNQENKDSSTSTLMMERPVRMR